MMQDNMNKNWSYDKESCAVVHSYVGHFSNPVRLRLLCSLMDGRASVNELVERVGERQPNVSQQLRLLLLAGLVKRTRQGTRQIYEIAKPLVADTLQHLSQVAETMHDKTDKQNRQNKTVTPAPEQSPESKEHE